MTPPSSANKTSKQLLFLYRVVKFLSVIRLMRSPDLGKTQYQVCLGKSASNESRGVMITVICYNFHDLLVESDGAST